MAEVTEERPRSSIEAALYDIWRDVLGVRHVRLTDDLATLRADEPATNELWRRIRERFGAQLPASMLRANPTIATLAMALRGDATRDGRGTLVSLQPGRMHTPAIYCFHPMGGSLAVYASLLAKLGRRWPVHGLQAIGLVDGAQPDRTIAAMAARYAAAIRAEHDPRPSVFLGYSMGGLIALEAAAALVDTWPAPDVVLIDTDVTGRAGEPMSDLQALAEVALRLDLDLGDLAGMDRDEAFEVIRDTAVAQGRLPARFSVARLRRIADVCAANQEAATAYSGPPAHAGRLHVVRAAVDHTPLDGLRATGDLTVHNVLGEHETLFAGPGLAQVGAVLRHVAADLETAAQA